MNNDRNEHFKEFARLLFPEVSQLFFTLYARISELRPIEEIDAVELEIKTLIAQRAYDLVYHTRVKTAYGMDLLYIKQWIELDVPDMTEWPPS